MRNKLSKRWKLFVFRPSPGKKYNSRPLVLQFPRGHCLPKSRAGPIVSARLLQVPRWRTLRAACGPDQARRTHARRGKASLSPSTSARLPPAERDWVSAKPAESDWAWLNHWTVRWSQEEFQQFSSPLLQLVSDINFYLFLCCCQIYLDISTSELNNIIRTRTHTLGEIKSERSGSVCRCWESRHSQSLQSENSTGDRGYTCVDIPVPSADSVISKYVCQDIIIYLSINRLWRD